MTAPYPHAEPHDTNKLHATERHNGAAKNVHAASVRDNLVLLNEQQAKITDAVALAIPAIETLVTVVLQKMKQGGRLFYIGAGTSGRLGVLDASEMPPTYGTEPQLVQGIIAGGDNALRNPDEIAEDSVAMGVADTAHVTDKDVLVGISASGSAVYVRGALQHAGKRGVYTAAICTAADAPLLGDVTCRILAMTPPEIPAGSTRMFSGTAQKMILDMIGDCIMADKAAQASGNVCDNLSLLHAQQAKLTDAIAKVIPDIDILATTALQKIRAGGRLFYIGSRTSGRLGVLDASEMPPTYGTNPELVQGIIAGGDHALRHSDGRAENCAEQGAADTAQITDKDVLVGLFSGIGLSYVRGAVQATASRGVYTAAICTVPDAPLLHDVNCPVMMPSPAEIRPGSHSISGTAQKMILNMISTSVMIGMGKVYGGYMIDVMTNNEKLKQRAVKMVVTLAGCDEARAAQLVGALGTQTKNPVKPAVVMALEEVYYEQAQEILAQHDGRIDAVMRKHGRHLALGCD